MGEVRVSLEGHSWAKRTDGGLDGLLQGLTPNSAHVCEVRVSRAAAPQQAEHAEGGAKTFSYEELKSGVPAGVDPTKKEQYLSDADFEKIMKSPRSEFNEMKAWKQAQLKKAAGLY